MRITAFTNGKIIAGSIISLLLVGLSFKPIKASQYDEEKVTFFQKLSSCQSLVTSIIDLGEDDHELHHVYDRLGMAYLKDAEASFTKLKSLNPEMDENMIVNINALLNMYHSFFEHKDVLSTFQQTSALVLKGHLLQKILENVCNSNL